MALGAAMSEAWQAFWRFLGLGLCAAFCAATGGEWISMRRPWETCFSAQPLCWLLSPAPSLSPGASQKPPMRQSALRNLPSTHLPGTIAARVSGIRHGRSRWRTQHHQLQSSNDPSQCAAAVCKARPFIGQPQPQRATAQDRAICLVSARLIPLGVAALWAWLGPVRGAPQGFLQRQLVANAGRAANEKPQPC